MSYIVALNERKWLGWRVEFDSTCRLHVTMANVNINKGRHPSITYEMNIDKSRILSYINKIITKKK